MSDARRAASIRSMFSAIAPTYDLLNRLLSFGVDSAWRRSLVANLPRGRVRVLDLACGTGDVAFAARAARAEARVFGADFALPMLTRARAKAARRGDPLPLANGSAEDLPYRDASFDAVTMAFGIRNVVRRERALSEIRRVLRPGGVALLLDFSTPTNACVRSTYAFYFHRVLPLAGGLISGDHEAYRYLPESVAAFPARGEFARLLEDAGFVGVGFEDYTFGVATLYRGKVPARPIPSDTAIPGSSSHSRIL